MDKDGYNDTQGAYERGFIDGMQKQAQSSVDRAVNAMTRQWQGLTDEERNDCLVEADPCECLADPEAQELMRVVEEKLRSKNT